MFSNGPRPRVGFRIVNRNLLVQVAEVAAMEAFRQVQGVGSRMSSLVQPRLPVKTGRLDHQRVALPLTGRASLPARLAAEARGRR